MSKIYKENILCISKHRFDEVLDVLDLPNKAYHPTDLAMNNASFKLFVKEAIEMGFEVTEYVSQTPYRAVELFPAPKFVSAGVDELDVIDVLKFSRVVYGNRVYIRPSEHLYICIDENGKNQDQTQFKRLCDKYDSFFLFQVKELIKGLIEEDQKNNKRTVGYSVLTMLKY